MLRVAVPNKGGLAPAAAQMLREAGYRQRTDDKDLTCLDADNEVEFFYLRPRDIATYVASGDLDLGITGRDLLIDAGAEADEVLDLGFGASTFRFAARPGRYATSADLAGARIATAYPGRGRPVPAGHGIKAEVIRLDGAVENAVGLGLADVIADVVDTGGTLRQAGPGAGRRRRPALDGRADPRRGAPATGRSTQLVRRLSGVLVARRYVMLAYDVRADNLDAAVRAHPGHRVADHLAAAPGGLGGGAGDGAARPRSTRSWTSCTSWAPGPSSSPTSTPAASDLCACSTRSGVLRSWPWTIALAAVAAAVLLVGLIASRPAVPRRTAALPARDWSRPLALLRVSDQRRVRLPTGLIIRELTRSTPVPWARIELDHHDRPADAARTAPVLRVLLHPAPRAGHAADRARPAGPTSRRSGAVLAVHRATAVAASSAACRRGRSAGSCWRGAGRRAAAGVSAERLGREARSVAPVRRHGRPAVADSWSERRSSS